MIADLFRLLSPGHRRREQVQNRIAELRIRDGDRCARCRRTLRFDLPDGHDQSARIEPVDPAAAGPLLDNLCLTHGRCHSAGRDDTGHARERLRPAREAQLFAAARGRRAA